MKAIVKMPVAPLFSEPNNKSERTDEILHGWQVEILAVHGDFFEVLTDYGYKGFVGGDTLTLDAHPNYFQELHSLQVIATNFADIVAEANVRSNVICTLPRGSFVYTLEVLTDYTAVLLANKATAYVRNEVLQKPAKQDNEKLLRKELVNTAKLYLGTQYRWGGKTPLGIDCSGLTFMAYRQSGISIWRDAVFKEGFGIKKIPLEQAKKGDLVYFPGHIAMLADDEKNIIHSSFAKNGVAVESLLANPKLSQNILYCASPIFVV